jgi:hypothetical protein
MTGEDASALTRDGLAALQSGRARDAHALFSRAVAAEPASPAYYLLAQACRLLGDNDGEKAALDRHLQHEPRHLPALLLMAEHLARRGDDRAASSFYHTAFAVAGQASGNLPPALSSMLQRGHAFVQAANQRLTAHLMAAVDAGGIEDGRAGRRLRQSVDLLLGTSQLYLQQPSMFYFPGLPQRQFYERDEFGWVAEVEAATAAIRQEVEQLLAAQPDFQPYVERAPDRPAPANHLLDDPSWGAFYLWKSGELTEDGARHCPAALAALEAAPIPVIAGRSPMALFSRLKPGTHIRPHHGLVNTRLICHLPIIVPDNCALRVGNETRAWREGEMLLFDDSIEHEAWNRSDRDRVVLLFEVWRPEISAVEREGITRIYEAIGTYGPDE